MELTIAICTYNRCELLRQTLESLLIAYVPDNNQIELIIVDNNSKDSTLEVTQNFILKSPFYTQYIFEKNQGLSFARNTAVRNASGDIIAFIDDDVIVDRYFIANLIKYYRDYKVSCIGGKILPNWECEPPKWLTDGSYYYILALIDHGNKAIYLTKPHLWGANISFRKEIFTEYGLFNTTIGRKKKNLLGGEETELLNKLLKANRKILYAPDVMVRHFVQKERMTRKYFMRYYYFYGLSEAHNKKIKVNRSLLNIPLYLYKNFFIEFYYYIRDLMPFKRLLTICHLTGFAMGCRETSQPRL